MADPRQFIELILSNRIFSSLTPIEAAALFKAGTVRSISATDVLFRQGEVAEGFFLVLSGSFGVDGEPARGDGPRERLATIGAGEAVGEMGLVRAESRSATVVAIEDAMVWHLGSPVFESLLRSGDPIGSSILKGIGRDMCRRFRTMVDESHRLVLVQGGSGSLIDTLGWEL